ncbi:outer membrane lipoprotein-sorting protein [Myxococcota bacterium]|nr:outer membrane lipoprotein-sorting protein [Myxococcota bacterium]
MPYRFSSKYLLIVALSFSLSAVALAEYPVPQNPLDLVDQVFNRSAWDDMAGTVILTMRNARGDTKVREIKLSSRRNKAGESAMLMRFIKPADVRGTGFLMIEHNDGEDDRRLFLPALRRIKRISASGSGGSFMGSDFTYYDIGKPQIKDWKYAFGKDKVVDGIQCRTIIGTAISDTVKSDTGYSKIEWHIDENRGVTLSADYFDKSGKLFKSMLVKKLEKVSDRLFATHIFMEDVVSKQQSEMVFKDLATNQGIPEKTFTNRNLQRWTR